METTITTSTIWSELAEEWDLRDMYVDLKPGKDATFADGTPVTAKDVKWAFNRTMAKAVIQSPRWPQPRWSAPTSSSSSTTAPSASTSSSMTN